MGREARVMRFVLVALVLFVGMGARHQSANFVVETADPRLAVQFAETAERFRRDLALEWLGQAMPNWSQPCIMTVQVGQNLGAGGATTFVFDHGEVFGWRMNIQGSAERVMDSVLPHEITHMIFASYFRRPLPRWADEGGATSVECSSEKAKHRKMLVQFLRTGRGIAFNQMFVMTEYPRDVMPLYAQSYALADYLIQQGGRRKYIEFLSDGLRQGQWSAAVQQHYGLTDLSVLQNNWVAWVGQGFPEFKPATATLASSRRPRPEPNLIYHVPNQSPGGEGVTPAVSVAGRPGPESTSPSTGWRAPASTDGSSPGTTAAVSRPPAQ